MKRLVMSGLTAVLMFFSISCGDSEVQYIQSFKYNVENNQISVELEFNRDLTLNTDVIVPILEYGSVSLFSSDEEHGLRIAAALNMDAFVDSRILRLERTRKLPNGQPMSTYVTTDVARLWVRATKNAKVAASAYLGLDPEKVYVGTSVELSFLDANFPQGLVLSQRIRDDRGRMLGVITLFGPEVENKKVIAPGGVFFITNASDLAAYIQHDKEAGEQPAAEASIASFIGDDNAPMLMFGGILTPEEKTYVNTPEYEKKEKQAELLQLYNTLGRQSGLVD